MTSQTPDLFDYTTAWFVNEDGGIYEYRKSTQADDFPNDDHTPHETREAAEAADTWPPVARPVDVARPPTVGAGNLDSTGVRPALDGGPMTFKAAMKAMGRGNTTRRAVMGYIVAAGTEGAISDEIEQALVRPHQTISATVNSLWNDLLITRAPGRTRPTRWGNDAQVYVASAQGLEAWAAIQS